MIPEQRALRIARIGPEQVAGVAASDQEIAAYYNANQAPFGAKETRNAEPGGGPRPGHRRRHRRAGQGRRTLAAAAAPAGANAAVTSLQNQSRAAYAAVAGDKAAAAVFAAASGAVVGPVQSDFGWVVVKVESVKAQSGKSLAQASPKSPPSSPTPSARPRSRTSSQALQNAIDDGSNFAEAAAQAKLPVETTPLITGDGKSRANPAFQSRRPRARRSRPASRSPPTTRPRSSLCRAMQGFAMVSPAQVVPAAPAPLATIRDLVASSGSTSRRCARAQARRCDRRQGERGDSLADAVKQAGIPLPAVRPVAARRIQLAAQGAKVPPPLQLLFTLGQGRSKCVADAQGRGYFVVKVNKIVPGNALLAAGLIGQMQNELQQAASQDYAQQFVAAIRADMKVKRNDKAIQAEKRRIATSGS